MYALVRYKSGLTRVIGTTLDRSNRPYGTPNWARVDGKIVDLEFETIGGRAVPVVNHETARASAATTLVQQPGSGFVVYHDGFLFRARIDVPFDWLSPDPYVTFVLLPFPVVWDVVTSPIQLYAVLAIDDWP